MNKRFIELLVLWCCGVAYVIVAQASDPPLEFSFLPPTDPVLDPTCIEGANLASWNSNTRRLVFQPIDKFEVVSVGTEMATLDLPEEVRNRTASAMTPYGPVYGSVQSSSYIQFGIVKSPANSTTIAAYLYQDEVEAQLGVPYPDSVAEGTILFQVTGGSVRNLRLHQTYWTWEFGFAENGFERRYKELSFLVDWENGPKAPEHEFFYCSIVFWLDAATDSESYLPLPAVETYLLGASAEYYVASAMSQVMAQFFGGDLHLKGAAPEKLVLYDTSPARAIPSGPLTNNLYWVMDGASARERFEEFASAVNQYDAGFAWGLPTRFADPAPPFGFNYSPGGNSCGVTSLRLALNWVGARSPTSPEPLDPLTIYEHVMWPDYGASETHFFTDDNAQGAYDWCRAQSWINKSHDSLLLLPGTYCQYLVANTPAQIQALWAIVDDALDRKAGPLLIRTDLTSRPTPAVGGGHVILLLGKGRSPYVAQAYGTSGDYYIVADPAGHYFANMTGRHYGQIQSLMDLNIGINQGGWYAIYPSELLQKRNTDKDHGGVPVFKLQALTLLVPAVQSFMHSPASLSVTDPFGRSTGLQEGGTVVTAIPNSIYEVQTVDEEGDEGGSTVVPDGSQMVLVINPAGGKYAAGGVGTGNGNYTLDWNYKSVTAGFEGSVTRPVQAGERYDQELGLVPPQLTISATGPTVVLSWGTNLAAFRLEAAESFSTGNWSPVGSPPAIVGDQLVVTNMLEGGARFFRLVSP